MSRGQQGRKHTEETKQKMRKSMKGIKKGQIAWNKGIPHSEETKQKIKETKRMRCIN